MFAALRRDFRSAPVTFSLLAASVVLFLAVELTHGRLGDGRGSAAVFGAVSALTLSVDKEVFVFGPLDLWEGPWWRWLRIPASAFHHANLLHLFCNVSFLWMLGPLLERRMRRAAYLGFWFFSALVPLMPEFYLENYAVGLSGVGCAMFGWCLIERQFDPTIARRLHEQAVRGIWMFLFLCVILTAFGILQVANLAHFTGVGYGWLNARASHHRKGRWAWIAAHALLPLAIFFVLHPLWNGRYHALIGLRAAQQAKDVAAGVTEFRKAILHDPSLSRCWLYLAAERAEKWDWLSAWRLAIEGLQHNRSSEKLTEFARDVWQRLPDADRESARESLRQAFGDSTSDWSKRLQMSPDSMAEMPASSVPDVASPQWDAIELSPSEPSASERSGRRGRQRSTNKIDPEKADSALEGRTL